MSARVVILAPHPDDESLGAGGTLRRHVDEGDEVHVIIATGGSGQPHPLFTAEQISTVQHEARGAVDVLGATSVVFLELEPVLYAEQPRHLTHALIHRALEERRPDILYVPFPYDLHHDHRALFHAASVAWRPTSDLGRSIRTVLAYEVVSETHWQATAFEPAFSPTRWVTLSEAQLAAKLRALRCYESQMHSFPHARSAEAVQHLARWRGSLVGAPAAEAFVVVRDLR